jgi:hypothetical protein
LIRRYIPRHEGLGTLIVLGQHDGQPFDAGLSLIFSDHSLLMDERNPALQAEGGERLVVAQNLCRALKPIATLQECFT